MCTARCANPTVTARSAASCLFDRRRSAFAAVRLPADHFHVGAVGMHRKWAQPAHLAFVDGVERHLDPALKKHSKPSTPSRTTANTNLDSSRVSRAAQKRSQVPSDTSPKE